MIPRTPIFTLFPYTTLFRSGDQLIIYREDLKTEWVRFSFPRQTTTPKRCISDFFLPKEGSDARRGSDPSRTLDRKSTRLNSSHANISYAVFCLKKKKKKNHI